jgi:hypothetical protein
MHEQSGGSQRDSRTRLQRAIVLTLLGGEPGRRWSRARLAAELQAQVPAVDDALRSLARAGVVFVAGDDVWASPATRLLDDLQLLAV